MLSFKWTKACDTGVLGMRGGWTRDDGALEECGLKTTARATIRATEAMAHPDANKIRDVLLPQAPMPHDGSFMARCDNLCNDRSSDVKIHPYIRNFA